jgi:hypothetical protein
VVGERCGRWDLEVDDRFGINLEGLDFRSVLEVKDFDEPVFITHDNFDLVLEFILLWCFDGAGELHRFHLAFDVGYLLALVLSVVLAEVIQC